MPRRTRDFAAAGEAAELIPLSLGVPHPSIERRIHTFLASLVLHLTVLGVLVVLDPPPRPTLVAAVPTEEELLEGETYDITWYMPKQELPSVTPLRAAAENGAANKALHRSERQTIVANDPNPDSDRQMILGPAPEIKIESNLPLPNVIAWNTPEIARPRFQLEQQQPSAPERQALAADAAPEIAVPSTERLDLESLRKRDPLRYQAEQAERQAPTHRALDAEAAPELVAAAEAIDLAALIENPRLRYWTESTALEAPEVKAVDAPTAPVIDSPRNSELNLGVFQDGPLLRYQTAEQERSAPRRATLAPTAPAPSIVGAAANGNGVDLAGAGARELLARLAKPNLPPGVGSPDGRDGGRLRARGGIGEVSIGSASGVDGGKAGKGEPGAAVVGLDPDPNAKAAIPIGSRRGRFSASPDGGPGGGQLGGGPVNSAALRVPNLSISGGAPAGSGLAVVPGRSVSGAKNPSDSGIIDELRRFSGFTSPRDLGRPPLIEPGPVDLPPPNDPDILFMDRDVFALAINMPNITSQSGSWIIRFAERVKDEKKRDDKQRARNSNARPEGDEPPKAPLSAPAARRKVDPKYIRTAMNEGIEGIVLLYAVIDTSGVVSSVHVMESLDERLDDSAVAALLQWKFDPATRSGTAVEVDAVVEVPFHLLPPERRVQRF